MRNKRGQIYLIATIIIVAGIIGFVTISNYAQKQDSVKIYDLGEELNIEGENVLDYGIYNGLDKNETVELLQNFVETYSKYLGEEIDIYLLIGDDESVIVIGQEGLENKLEVDFGITGAVSKKLKKYASKTFTPKEGDFTECDKDDEKCKTADKTKKRIKVKIKKELEDKKDKEYEFDLNEGENFYFIISQNIGEETYVTTN